MRKFLLLTPLLLWAMTIRAEVNHLRIETLFGMEQQCALASIGKLVLGTDELCLYDQKGDWLGCTSLAQVGSIVFYEETSISTSLDEVAKPTVQVFPNPTQDALFIRGVGNEQTVRLFSLKGQLILSTNAKDGEAVLQVGTLEDATYLLQIGAQVVKVIKY